VHSSAFQAVAISGCGHYGISGTDDGHMFKYAMQSGHFRGEFIDLDTDSGSSGNGDSQSCDYFFQAEHSLFSHLHVKKFLFFPLISSF
jgi:hypothetical protein